MNNTHKMETSLSANKLEHVTNHDVPKSAATKVYTNKFPICQGVFAALEEGAV